MFSCAAGGIMWSSAAIRYQLGLLRQAGSVSGGVLLLRNGGTLPVCGTLSDNDLRAECGARSWLERTTSAFDLLLNRAQRLSSFGRHGPVSFVALIQACALCQYHREHNGYHDQYEAPARGNDHA
jgi:hypothetical protein